MSAVDALKGHAVYESPGSVAEYLLFHYGDADEVFGELPGPRDAVGFATRIVAELIAPTAPDARALDIGCAVGATSFELSKSCTSVLGIDFSEAFIHAARGMQRSGNQSGIKRVEGHRVETFQARLPDDARVDRVAFEVGDACDLRPDIGTFDIVFAANLICRLPDPRAFLSRLPDLVSTGGQLILTTPFTWMEEYTPVSAWLGATPESGPSFDALRVELEDHFSLELKKDIPFLIREHSRKFQYTVAQGSRWRRR
jgi:putative 4-mercaptohistidine N1-methyltranferase